MSSLVKLPDEVVERKEVTCHAGPLGVRLAQIRSGLVIVNGFQRVKPGTGVKGSTVGPVEASKKVAVGDALLCINDEAVELMTYDMVLGQLRTAPRPIVLTFGRTSENVAARIAEQAREAAAADARARKGGQKRQNPVRGAKRSSRTTPAALAAAEAAGVPGNTTVYTARDFKSGRFSKYQKLFGVIFILSAAMVAMYFVSFKAGFASIGEDDLQQYEEWKARKEIMDAAVEKNNENRKKCD